MEKHGRSWYLMSTDLRKPENCRKVAEAALEKMGGVNILVGKSKSASTSNLLLIPWF